MKHRPDALEVVFGDDTAAIRAELESSTVEEIALRYDIERFSVLKVEKRQGVRCMRICAQCKARLPASAMRITVDGKIGQICNDCTPAKKTVCKTSHRERTLAEYMEVDQWVYQQARVRWGRSEGLWCRYWQGRAIA